jgi:hypothetical protein
MHRVISKLCMDESGMCMDLAYDPPFLTYSIQKSPGCDFRGALVSIRHGQDRGPDPYGALPIRALPIEVLFLWLSHMWASVRWPCNSLRPIRLMVSFGYAACDLNFVYPKDDNPSNLVALLNFSKPHWFNLIVHLLVDLKSLVDNVASGIWARHLVFGM